MEVKGRVPEDTSRDSVPPWAHGERSESDELRLGLDRERNSNMWVSSSVEGI